MKFLLSLFFIILDCVLSQNGTNLDTEIKLDPVLLSSIFPEPCQCVKQDLCKSSSTNTNDNKVDDIGLQNSCESDLLKCCKKEHILNVTIETRQQPSMAPSRICGKRNLNGVGYRIANSLANNEAQFGEFPWMVAILQENRSETENTAFTVYRCGGSLIHPQVILTSAHCIKEPGKKLTIRAGEWDTSSTSENIDHQERVVKSILIHPNFNRRAYHNDVALLIVYSPFELKANVETICLPSQDEVLGNVRCISTGWGKPNFTSESKLQTILKKVDLPIVQSDDCQAQLRRTRLEQYFILDKSLICAGGELGKDTCDGDGGSPLICPIPGKKGRYYQRGLVAWGIGCGNEIPAAYGNVANFRNWIDTEMSKLRFDTSTYAV